MQPLWSRLGRATRGGEDEPEEVPQREGTQGDSLDAASPPAPTVLLQRCSEWKKDLLRKPGI